MNIEAVIHLEKRLLKIFEEEGGDRDSFLRSMVHFRSFMMRADTHILPATTVTDESIVQVFWRGRHKSLRLDFKPCGEISYGITNIEEGNMWQVGGTASEEAAVELVKEIEF